MPEYCAAIVIAAKHSELIKVKDVRGATNTIGALRCKFEFRTDDWLRSTKTAMFYDGNALTNPLDVNSAIPVLLDDDDECAVPTQVLSNNKPYSVGVWGVTESGLRIVSRWIVFDVVDGCFVEGTIPEEPEQSVYEQILEKMNSVNYVPYIGDNGNWYTYDASKKEYVDSGKTAEGKYGPQGNPGITPHIATNGNWWIGTVDTGVRAQGIDGKDGSTPFIGNNNNWWIGNIDTKVRADGKDGRGIKTIALTNDYQILVTMDDGETFLTNSVRGKEGAKGEDGLTPFINTNGNWFIGTEDTGVSASGVDGIGISHAELSNNELKITLSDGTTYNLGNIKGDQGLPGKNGNDGLTPFVGNNGNWCIGDTDTGVMARGTDGVNGSDGITPHIDANGNWYIGTTDTGVRAEGINGDNGISCEHKWDGTTLTITSASGTSSVDLKGDAGNKGSDGISCEHSWNGTVLTVTSSSGTSSMDLKGEPGASGSTPVKGIDYFTDTDKTEIVNLVLAALPNGDEVSY